MDNDHQPTTESILTSALSTLTTYQISTLSQSLSTTFHRHNHHLATLLASPTLFTHTLNHLYSLSLPQKSLLIAQHLLSFLHLLTPLFPTPPPTTPPHKFRLRDLDSVLLLLLFCEIRHLNPTNLNTSPANWQGILKTYCSDTMLNLSRLEITSKYNVLGKYIDLVTKFRNYVKFKGCSRVELGKEEEVATAMDAAVALPSVEVEDTRDGIGAECVICKEKMEKGRDVCQLPCQHLFHWICVLPWLRKRNTCPCCRFLLPTNDVYGEIERLWDAIVKVGLQAS